MTMSRMPRVAALIAILSLAAVAPAAGPKFLPVGVAVPDGATTIAEDRQGRIYLAVAGEKGQLVRIADDKAEVLAKEPADSVAVAVDGTIWFAQGGKVYSLDPAKPDQRADRSEGFSPRPGWTGRVFCSTLGEVWVEGAKSFLAADGKFRPVPTDYLDAISPAPVCQGQCGNWYGIQRVGEPPVAWWIAGLLAPLRTRWVPFGRGDGLQYGLWVGVVCDHVGFVWSAEPRTGAWRLDPRAPDKGWEQIWEGRRSLPSSLAATALARCPDDRAMVATLDGRVLALDKYADGNVVIDRLDAGEFKGLTVRALHTDALGRIWAVAGGKVFRRDATAGAWQKNWRALPRLPYGNHDIFGVVLNGRYYMAGGMANHGYPAVYKYFDDMFVYDPNAGRWSLTAPMDIARCYSGMATMDGKIWVIGGGIDIHGKRRAVPWVEIYDPAKNTWTDGPDLDRPRMEVSCGEIGGRMYVAAGNNPGGNTMVSIAPGETAWRAEPNLPPARKRFGGQAGSTVMGGKLWIFFGGIGLVSYEPATKAWKSDYPQPPGGQLPWSALVAAHKGEIWVMGGRTTETPRATWHYNPTTNQWTQGPDLPHEMAWAGAGSVNGKLIVAAGAWHSAQHKYYIFTDTAYELRE